MTLIITRAYLAIPSKPTSLLKHPQYILILNKRHVGFFATLLPLQLRSPKNANLKIYPHYFNLEININCLNNNRHILQSPLGTTMFSGVHVNGVIHYSWSRHLTALMQKLFPRGQTELISSQPAEMKFNSIPFLLFASTFGGKKCFNFIKYNSNKNPIEVKMKKKRLSKDQSKLALGTVVWCCCCIDTLTNLCVLFVFKFTISNVFRYHKL